MAGVDEVAKSRNKKKEKNREKTITKRALGSWSYTGIPSFWYSFWRMAGTSGRMQLAFLFGTGCWHIIRINLLDVN